MPGRKFQIMPSLLNIDQYKKQIRSKFKRTDLPFVTLKYAQTLDGKIATKTGDSRWISSLSSRRLAHLLRSLHQAVLVGVNTIIQDDPQLTVRLVKGMNPIRIVVDSKLRSPLKARVFNPKRGTKTILATTLKADKKKVEKFEERGVEVLLVKTNKAQRVDLEDLLQKLGEKKIKSVLVEGGSKIITSFLKEKLADRLIIIIAPIIMGKGLSSVNDRVMRNIRDSFSFSCLKLHQYDKDLVLDGLIKKT
jgi:diaminohydroxyphosphoribosylaminopyrimidine deaminase/5-amino-6-(5-phosphoribosylamino)uracil reductase